MTAGVQAADATRVLILSASSAAPVVQELASQFTDQSGVSVLVSIGSSGALARQINQGAPADIYISASPQWTDQLVSRGRLDQRHIAPLARNQLVLVGPNSSRQTGVLNVSKPLEILRRLDGGRMAIGDPSHVPAGHYAKEAIANLGIWPAVRDRLALQSNVRAVLAMVERGETPLGIIYATDAALSDHIRLAAIIPPELHAPIEYSVSVLTGRDLAPVMAFYRNLLSPKGRAMFERYGFGVVQTPTSIQSLRTTPSTP
ncbi:MAG: molybdate ABC transporter substrate-binding protein [Rhodospirillaceae bacterium]|nr:molybdate ABC transporter substrate-binding protein [Rhodospirillaceae bacterium]